MKYDFTSILQREGKDSLATDFGSYKDTLNVADTLEGFDRIPMWIADMSFATLPSAVEAMKERASHPVFGYFKPSQQYYQSIIDWQSTQNRVNDLTLENIGYQNGVLGGLISSLNILCSRGDKILIHSPTYNGFTGSTSNNGHSLIHSPLYRDEDGIWRMDYADMEKKIIENNIHTCIFCSPHNPTGRVWEEWELAKAMELFVKYDVYIVSDEIWSDLLLHGCRHIPLQSISDEAKNRTIALYSPSKTFNLAGLVGSYHIVYNNRLHDRLKKECSLSCYNEPNVMSLHALIGSYTRDGREWLGELREVIASNMQYAYNFFTREISGVSLAMPQGTYILLIECSEWLKNNNKTIDELVTTGYKYGVIWVNGKVYFAENSIRLNLALPLSRLQEVLERLKKYVFI